MLRGEAGEECRVCGKLFKISEDRFYALYGPMLYEKLKDCQQSYLGQVKRRVVEPEKQGWNPTRKWG